MKNIWKVFTLIPEYRWQLAAITLSSTVIGFAGTATPYLFKDVVDTITKLAAHKFTVDEASHALILTIGAFALLRVLVIIFSYRLERQSDTLWLKTIQTLRNRVFNTMTGLSLEYYEKTRAGDVMDRFGATIQITQYLFQLSEGTLASILQLFFGIGVLLFKAPVIGAIMLVVIPFNLVISFFSVQKTKPLRRKWNRLVGVMSGLLNEMISQIATVRSFAGERIVKKRYDDVQVEWLKTRLVETSIEQRSAAGLNLINGISIVASLAIVSLGALRGQFSVGDILLVLTLTQNLINTIQPITRLVNGTGDVDVTAERLVELLEVNASVTDRPDAVALRHIDNIEFRNVSFAYPGKDQNVLNNVSFQLKRGELLALVGPSGSGKSTVIKLLMRLYDPSEGAVLINGQDLASYQQESVRMLMGVVLQDVALFNETIGENIRFARQSASLEEVVAAATTAHADAFIQNMPEGYETMVGERGVRLSGGEKQRVAIARALLRDPSLIILDEATSALDSESERFVQDGLDKLMYNRTSIVIAHRLSTIAHADKIVVMQGGRIVEIGDHGTLLENPEGLYARLHALQVELREPAESGDANLVA